MVQGKQKIFQGGSCPLTSRAYANYDGKQILIWSKHDHKRMKSFRFLRIFGSGRFIKDARTQGERDLASADILWTRGVFRCGRSHFLM